MTGNKFLLDTNIIIEIFNGNKVFADKIGKSSEVYISSIVIGELYVGIYRSVNKLKHLKKLNDFLETCKVLNVDSRTAEHYGECLAYLYKKGKPIPTNDIWIAATAIRHDLTLVTSDKHFDEMKDVLIQSW